MGQPTILDACCLLSLVTATAAVLKQILGGGTYVNVHTAKNAGGEIRGQIASS